MNNERLEKKGIKRLDEDSIEVTTKDGIFILEDIKYDKLSKARKRDTGDGASMICTYVTKKDGVAVQLGELDIKEYRGSTGVKLAFAANLLQDPDGLGEDFLSQ